MREELPILGFENSLNSLNPANSSLAASLTGRAEGREIRKSKSRITKIPEKMSKNFILFKEEIQMREELLILGFENSLNSEKSLISENSLNSLNPEKSLNSANSSLAAPSLTGRACPAREGGRGFRFRAEEKEIRKSKSRITKFSEKKGKNAILYKRKSA